MRKVVTKVSHSSIVVSLSDIRRERGRACSQFGPVRAGLTTSQTTPDQQLTELLSCLEREVESLQFKYLEVCDTLLQDIVTVRARLIAGIKDITGIDVLN